MSINQKKVRTFTVKLSSVLMNTGVSVTNHLIADQNITGGLTARIPLPELETGVWRILKIKHNTVTQKVVLITEQEPGC